MSVQTTQQRTRTSGTPDRRRVLGAAAWAAPVIAFSVAAPAQAASVAGFEFAAHSGSNVGMDFGSYQGSDGSSQNGLVVTIDDDGPIPWATFTANQPGASARINNFYTVYSFPFTVTELTVSPGWQVTETPSAGGIMQYQITATGLPSAQLEVRTPLDDPTPDAISPLNSLLGPTMNGVASPAPPAGEVVEVGYLHFFLFTVTAPDGSLISNERYTLRGTHYVTA